MQQNNQMCIRPSGFIAAQCQTGIDHNFGPKNNTAGGSAPYERNVIGTTGNQGIEYSHGWNRWVPTGWSTRRGRSAATGRSATGRLLGDCSYDRVFRSEY